MTWVYPLTLMRREVAYISYHFHWGIHDVLSLPHPERVQWVDQIAEINRAILEA
jgi:hypothetical protein